MMIFLLFLALIAGCSGELESLTVKKTVEQESFSLWRGNWDSTVYYQENSIVAHDERIWIATRDNIAKVPGEGDRSYRSYHLYNSWVVFSEKGAEGGYFDSETILHFESFVTGFDEAPLLDSLLATAFDSTLDILSESRHIVLSSGDYRLEGRGRELEKVASLTGLGQVRIRIDADTVENWPSTKGIELYSNQQLSLTILNKGLLLLSDLYLDAPILVLSADTVRLDASSLAIQRLFFDADRAELKNVQVLTSSVISGLNHSVSEELILLENVGSSSALVLSEARFILSGGSYHKLTLKNLPYGEFMHSMVDTLGVEEVDSLVMADVFIAKAFSFDSTDFFSRCASVTVNTTLLSSCN